MGEIFLKTDILITSKTDLGGKITYCNEDFRKITSYSERELFGHPHSIIRHKIMPRAAFAFMWSELEANHEFFAFVANKAKNGNVYWVFANVVPQFDKDGKKIGYYSVRRRASKEGVEVASSLYSKMCEIEKANNGDYEKSTQFLLDQLNALNTSYEKLILSLQAKGEQGGYR